jgi:hypothetical protein
MRGISIGRNLCNRFTRFGGYVGEGESTGEHRHGGSN